MIKIGQRYVGAPFTIVEITGVCGSYYYVKCVQILKEEGNLWTVGRICKIELPDNCWKLIPNQNKLNETH